MLSALVLCTIRPAGLKKKVHAAAFGTGVLENRFIDVYNCRDTIIPMVIERK